MVRRSVLAQLFSYFEVIDKNIFASSRSERSKSYHIIWWQEWKIISFEIYIYGE